MVHFFTLLLRKITFFLDGHVYGAWTIPTDYDTDVSILGLNRGVGMLILSGQRVIVVH
jgi:hypothetical protein